MIHVTEGQQRGQPDTEKRGGVAAASLGGAAGYPKVRQLKYFTNHAINRKRLKEARILAKEVK